MALKETLFGNLDFNEIASNKDFKEADVRAVIIDPILKKLGFTYETILREKTLQSPFLRIGSKKRPVNLVPDYVLKVENGFAWVLDAKAPNQKIINDDNVEQVYSYATHPEIRSTYFALCNGLEFACFRTTETKKPVLYFRVEEIEKYWPLLQKILSPNSFQAGKTFIYEETLPSKIKKDEVFDYAARPLLDELPVKKRACKRHFGVHGYFTRQTWNVVNEYIKNFSQKGDLILDPFGGSGVTAIEAMVENRKAVSIDLNPMAVFIVNALLAPVSWTDFSAAYQRVRKAYCKEEPKNKEDIKTILKKYPGPKEIKLPKSADVETTLELFSPKQTAELSLLKHCIFKEKDKNIRDSLMLIFSGMITMKNLTYHTTRGESQISDVIHSGDTSVFRYYRYRIAPDPYRFSLQRYFYPHRKEQTEGHFPGKSAVTLLFWQVGTRINKEILHQKRADYGKQIVLTLSVKLSEKYGRNFELRNLRRMLQFAEQFPDKKIVSTLSTQLSWSHFIEFLPLQTSDAKLFYAQEAANQGFGIRE
ncbi:hypothetical protein FACS189485_07520 [Spirochaetia bacterium]|nr:hypothetical protein FACS189485_07520 [Spirochaetia bacterium]